VNSGGPYIEEMYFAYDYATAKSSTGKNVPFRDIFRLDFEKDRLDPTKPTKPADPADPDFEEFGPFNTFYVKFKFSDLIKLNPSAQIYLGDDPITGIGQFQGIGASTITTHADAHKFLRLIFPIEIAN